MNWKMTLFVLILWLIFVFAISGGDAMLSTTQFMIGLTILCSLCFICGVVVGLLISERNEKDRHNDV